MPWHKCWALTLLLECPSLVQHGISDLQPLHSLALPPSGVVFAAATKGLPTAYWFCVWGAAETANSCKWVSVPDLIVGSVRVMGRDSSDWGAHFGIFRNNHLGEWRGEDGGLLHIFHCHLDRRCVAKWAQIQEVGVDVPVCGFDSQRKAALGFKVERLEETKTNEKFTSKELVLFGRILVVGTAIMLEYSCSDKCGVLVLAWHEYLHFLLL